MLKSKLFLDIAQQQAQTTSGLKRTLAEMKDAHPQTSPMASPLPKRNVMVDAATCTTPSLSAEHRLSPPASSSVVKALFTDSPAATTISVAAATIADSAVAIPPVVVSTTVRFVVLAKSKYDAVLGQRLINFDYMHLNSKEAYRFKMLNELYDEYKNTSEHQVGVGHFCIFSNKYLFNIHIVIFFINIEMVFEMDLDRIHQVDISNSGYVQSLKRQIVYNLEGLHWTILPAESY